MVRTGRPHRTDPGIDALLIELHKMTRKRGSIIAEALGRAGFTERLPGKTAADTFIREEVGLDPRRGTAARLPVLHCFPLVNGILPDGFIALLWDPVTCVVLGQWRKPLLPGQDLNGFLEGFLDKREHTLSKLLGDDRKALLITPDARELGRLEESSLVGIQFMNDKYLRYGLPRDPPVEQKPVDLSRLKLEKNTRSWLIKRLNSYNLSEFQSIDFLLLNSSRADEARMPPIDRACRLVAEYPRSDPRKKPRSYVRQMILLKDPTGMA